MHWDQRSEKASESSAFFIILICYIIFIFMFFIYLLFTEIIIPMYICLIFINWLILKKISIVPMKHSITLEFIVPK